MGSRRPPPRHAPGPGGRGSNTACGQAHNGGMAAGAPVGVARERDLYALLGVAPDATPEEITAAFRALAKQLHPDRGPVDAEADETFKALSRAYTTLTRPRSRAAYDARRSARAMSAATSPAPTRPHQEMLATPRRAQWAIGGGIACIVLGLAITPVLLTIPTSPDTVGRDVTLWIVVAKLLVCGAILVGAGWWRLVRLRARS
jgi:hypothetical protein